MADLFTVLFASIFVFLVVIAVVSDVRTMIIPNWVSIVLVVEFLLYGLVFLNLSDVLQHSAVSLVVFAIGLGFYAFGWIGAGDVKLLAAVMLWAGPSHAGQLGLWTALCGAVLACGLIVLRVWLQLSPNAALVRKVLRRPVKWVEEGAFPYGMAIGAAALLTAPSIFGNLA